MKKNINAVVGNLLMLGIILGIVILIYDKYDGLGALSISCAFVVALLMLMNISLLDGRGRPATFSKVKAGISFKLTKICQRKDKNDDDGNLLYTYFVEVINGEYALIEDKTLFLDGKYVKSSDGKIMIDEGEVEALEGFKRWMQRPKEEAKEEKVH